ncbi:putative C6 transcription factor [Macroventuria anomochaeta]|uniref:C6 transcription factor n=1 Tax=Macroventuria anomochaeta TaxID=301207 RepID=A0ACB6S9M6_9PLEO|nr:putative C6 transcription factor [Macroventuria anomochaeta]KAF2630996.1 putative C6 transcription factor [Macroventuria anomochaeta]
MTETPRRRRRPAISCTLCRRRKIRCNKESPCSNCVRSRNALCVYETNPHPVPGHHIAIAPAPGAQHATSLPSLSSDTASISNDQTSIELESMKLRIQELEEQLSQVSTPASSAPSVTPKFVSWLPSHSTDQIKSTLGGTFDVIQESRLFGQAQAVVRSVAHKNRVFGQSHWISSFTLFRDIIEMIEPHMRSKSSKLLSDVQRAKMLARTIKAQRAPQWPTAPTKDIPPQNVCDVLVDGYLRTIETLYRIVHIPTFRKEYEAIWETGSQPSTGFMVQLKLILAIGATLYDSTFSMRIKATRWVYEAQSWLMSPAFKSKLGICFLQNNILILLARELVDVGGELIWISAGAVVRSAVYMGLHKDPAQLQNMSTLDAEMRRRIWNTILEISLQSSLVSGGPCFISLKEFDTQPPGNFNDVDLDASIPTAMASNYYTQSSIAIALRQTLPARLTVVKFLNDLFSGGTYDETLRLDRDLRSAYKDLRHKFQSYSTNAGPTPTQFELQAVDFVLHRYTSSLHVPFFSASLHEATYAYTRKRVVESSLKLWSLAGSSRAITSNPSFPYTEGDLPRLCRCGSGFFRAFAFQSASLLSVELRALHREDSISEVNVRPDLVNIVEDAADWYLHCIRAGETGIKGYMLLSILSAQIDALERNVSKDDMPPILVKAAEDASDRCMPLLEELAGYKQTEDEADPFLNMDFQQSAGFLEDWDTLMADVFNFGAGASFEALLI